MNDSTTTPVLFQLHGRIGRVRYLAYSFAFGMLVLLATLLLAGLAGDTVATWLSVGASAAIGIVVGGRRLHDLGRSRWIALGLLVPVVNLIIGLWLLFAPGSPAENRFGPAPGPNTRGVIALAWAVPVVFLAGVLAAFALAPHKSTTQRAHDEMEQGI
ncbi:DUF805 domain-containing protein [Massilia phyllosphaerae]|uniref:DUF805 domain-containing protein n=1 Tax=Massilia phyllosphaerae TaxID=3106034 RepID=UPI002B1CBABE|nr:DUF805 domain-containing protein [Massilia sp. SGZ-792]